MLKLAPLLMLAVACGGSVSPEVPRLDGSMAGSWTGPAVVAFDGLSPVSYVAHMSIAVDVGTATVSSICPDGSGGVLLATGDGARADWSGGSLKCPAMTSANCPAVVMTYGAVTLALVDGKLSVSAKGSGTGCGTTRNGTLSLNAGK